MRKGTKIPFDSETEVLQVESTMRDYTDSQMNIYTCPNHELTVVRMPFRGTKRYYNSCYQTHEVRRNA